MATRPKAPGPIDLRSLFEAAQARGELSQSSLRALSIDADMGAQIQAGLGVTPADVPASEVLLLTIMPDDSGSIRSAGNEQAVAKGHNLVLDALAASPDARGVLAHTRYLNGRVLFPYRPLERALRMDASNYDPNEGTPLYDQTAVLLGTVIAKIQEFEQAGVPVRSVTVIITDGADVHSQHHTAASVASLVADLQRGERHIVAGIGLADGQTDFRAVFHAMGLRDEWVLTPDADPEQLLAAFRMLSCSVLALSRGGVYVPGGATFGAFLS